MEVAGSGLRHRDELRVSLRIVGMGVMGEVLPLEEGGRDHDRHPGEPDQRPVEPGGPEGMPVGRLVKECEQMDDDHAVEEDRRRGPP